MVIGFSLFADYLFIFFSTFFVCVTRVGVDVVVTSVICCATFRSGPSVTLLPDHGQYGNWCEVSRDGCVGDDN